MDRCLHYVPSGTEEDRGWSEGGGEGRGGEW